MVEIIGLLAIVGVMVGSLIVPLRLQAIHYWYVWGSIGLVLIAGYGLLGHWSLWRAHQAEETRLAAAKVLMQSFKNADEVIAQLRAHLSKKPGEAKGWFLLGRLYSQSGRWHEAAQSFETAHRLAPSTEVYAVSALMSQFQVAHQEMSPELHQQFLVLLATYPTQPDLLAALATEATRQHQTTLALQYWRRVLIQLPAGSEEAAFVQQAIAKLPVAP